MPNQNFKRSTGLRALSGLAVGVLISAFVPGCGVGYVVRSAYFQAELLAKRTPVEEVRSSGQLSAKQVAALDRIADVKTFGAEIGLQATENYDTVAIHWDRTIWNMSACPTLSFEPATWWFPIVGRVPYLGFFRRQDADKWVHRMENQGHEVYLRTAGAYSTLGWFRDPILPGMLQWDDQRLADTVLHELAHATLWIKGSVKFNESFANFVGEVAAFRYLEDRFGKDSETYINAVSFHEELAVWRQMLRQLYQDLDAVYTDADKSDPQKLSERERIYQSLGSRVKAANFKNEDRFLAAVEKGPWNNARMIQYRTYNHKREWFQAILEQQDGDLLKFISAIDRITHNASDPYKALESAVTTAEPPK